MINFWCRIFTYILTYFIQVLFLHVLFIQLSLIMYDFIFFLYFLVSLPAPQQKCFFWQITGNSAMLCTYFCNFNIFHFYPYGVCVCCFLYLHVNFFFKTYILSFLGQYWQQFIQFLFLYLFLYFSNCVLCDNLLYYTKFLRLY